jgi:serine phosphatase RsbU (regulator of sigma subunit)
MNSSGLSSFKDALPLEQQVARLQALLEASRQVHSTIKVKEVLRQTARILVRELEMEGALFLTPGAGEAVVSYGELPAAPYEGCLRFPLLSRDQQAIFELVVAPPEGGGFGLYEQDFVEGLALQTAVAAENAVLHERDIEWARVQQDLNAARNVQRSLLPREMPQLDGFSVAGRSTTCYEVGGDYIDAIAMRDGSHLLVVADVAGKGLASAIVATSFRAALRSLAVHGLPLDELATRLNQQHWEEGGEARRRYVTAALLRLVPAEERIEIVNAGHNPLALVDSGGAVRMVEASGTPLGMLAGMSYSIEGFSFPPGTRILLYTDGLTEVFQGEDEFGTERLVQTFLDAPTCQAEQILDCLWKATGEFSNHAPQIDDMTALTVCHLVKQESATA